MPCATVTVTASVPTVTVSDFAFSWGTGCVNGNMSVCAAKLGEIIKIRATFLASVRASVKINVEYDKDGVVFYEGWYTILILEAGTTTLCLDSLNYTYNSGTYSNLKVTVSDIVAV